MIDQEEFHEALSQGEMDKAKRLTREALERGESAEAILKEGLVRPWNGSESGSRRARSLSPRS